MSWMKLGLFGSIVFVLYFYQQIKMTLKDKGYEVDLVTGWISDYKKFKQLIDKEPDKKVKTQYQQIITGLHFALLGVVVIAGFLIFGQ